MMKTDDINKLKGKLKSAVQKWANGKIEEILPERPQIALFLKNGINNLLAREDANINRWVDTMMLFAGNENGVIDSDSVIDLLAGMFREVKPRKYQTARGDIEIGNGEVALYLPHNFVFDLLAGDIDVVRMTADDLLELKNYIK